MKATVGRTVHYVAEGDAVEGVVCRAAIVTEVREGDTNEVGLSVLAPGRLSFYSAIPYDEKNSPGSWHWPERTE